MTKEISEIDQLKERLTRCSASAQAAHAENWRLKELLGRALGEHEAALGKFSHAYLPEHWSHQARAALVR